MSTTAMYGEVNGQPVAVLCYCGEAGKVIGLPVGDPSINLNDSGWSVYVLVAPYSVQSGAGSTPNRYNCAPSQDGTEALWTLQGTEFPPPTGGLFVVEFHGKNSVTGDYFKDRLLVRVKDAYT